MNTLIFRILLTLICVACSVLIYQITTLSTTPAPDEIAVFRKNMIAETRFLTNGLARHYKRLLKESVVSTERPHVKMAVNHAKRVMAFYDSAMIMIGKIRSSAHHQVQAQRYMNHYQTFVEHHESFFKNINQHPDNPINQYLFKKTDTFPKTYLYDQAICIELSSIILEYDLTYCMYEHMQNIVTFT